jgi:hypothetical protein
MAVSPYCDLWIAAIPIARREIMLHWRGKIRRRHGISSDGLRSARESGMNIGGYDDDCTVRLM